MKVLLLVSMALLLASCSNSPEIVPLKETKPYNLSARAGLNSTLPQNTAVSYSKGSPLERRIALTFDDGPHPVNTPRLLDILRQYEVPATFFVIGNLVDRYPAIARRIVEEGHEIANHTYTHANLSKLSDARIRKELADGKNAIVRATGVYPKVMRPPYGALKAHQRYLARSEFGYPTVLWSVDPLDWKRPGAAVVANRLVSGATNGGILLAHDLHAPTVDAIPSVVSRLKAQGYQFVTVSQIINRNEALKASAAAAAR